MNKYFLPKVKKQDRFSPLPILNPCYVVILLLSFDIADSYLNVNVIHEIFNTSRVCNLEDAYLQRGNYSSEYPLSPLKSTVKLKCRQNVLNLYEFFNAKVKLLNIKSLDALFIEFSISKHRTFSDLTRHTISFIPAIFPSKKEADAKLNSLLSKHELPCMFLFVYAEWCVFSSRAAPLINALASVYPQFSFYAINVDDYFNYKWNLGMFHVPDFKFLIGHKVIKEFNDREFSLENLVDFVWKSTHELPQRKLFVRPRDYYGPIPTQLVYSPWENYLFAAAWLCFSLSVVYYAYQLWRWIVDWMQSVSSASQGVSYMYHDNRLMLQNGE